MAEELRQCSSLHGKQPWIERDLMKLISETPHQKYHQAVARIVSSEIGEYFIDDGFHRIPAILDTISKANFIHGGNELNRLQNGMTICVLEYSYTIRLKDGESKFFMCVNKWEHLDSALSGNSDHLTDINSVEAAKSLLKSLIMNPLQDMDSSSQQLLSQFPKDSQTLSNLVRIANQAISQQNDLPLQASATESRSAQSGDVLSSDNSLNKTKTAWHPNQDHQLSGRPHTADLSHNDDCSLEEPLCVDIQQNNRTFIDSATDQDVSPTQLLERMLLEAEQSNEFHKSDQEKITCPGILFENKDPMETGKSAIPSSGDVCELTTPTVQDFLVTSDQRRLLAQIQDSNYTLSDDSSRDSSSLPAFLLPSSRNSNSSSLGNLFLQPTVKDYTNHNQVMPKNSPAFNHLLPGVMKENCLESSERIINDNLLSHNLPVEVITGNEIVNNETSVSGKCSSENLSQELVKENCWASSETNLSGKLSLSCDEPSGDEHEQKNSSASLFSETEHESSSLPFNLEFCNKPKESLTLKQQKNSSFPCSSESIESGNILQIVESSESDNIHQIVESIESDNIHQIVKSIESGNIHQTVESNESNNSIQSCDSVSRVYITGTNELSHLSENDDSHMKSIDCLVAEVLSTKCEPHIKLCEKQSNKCVTLQIIEKTAQATTDQGNVPCIDQISSSDITLDSQADSSQTALEAKTKHESVGLYEEAVVISSVIDLSSTDDIYMLDGLVNDSVSDSLTSSSVHEITSPFRPSEMSTQMVDYSPQGAHFESADKDTTGNMACLVNSFNSQDITSSPSLTQSNIDICVSEGTASISEEQSQPKGQDLFPLDSISWHTGSEQTKDDASYTVSQNNSSKMDNISHKSTTDGVLKMILQNITTTINKSVHMKAHVALPVQDSKMPVATEMGQECNLPPVDGARNGKDPLPSHNCMITSKSDSPSSSKISGCAHEQVTKELRVLLTDIMKRKTEEPPSPCQPLMKKVRILLTDIMKSNTDLLSNGRPNLSNTTRHSPDQCSTAKKRKNQQTTDVNWTVKENNNQDGVGSYKTRSHCKLQKHGQSVGDLTKKQLMVSVIDIAKHYNALEIRRLSQQSPGSSLSCTSSAKHKNSPSKLGGNAESREQFTSIKDKYPVEVKRVRTRSQISPGSEKGKRTRYSQSEILGQERRQSKRKLTNKTAQNTSCEYYGQNNAWTSTSPSDHVATSSPSLFKMTASYGTSDWRNVTPVINSSSELESQPNLLGQGRLPPASFMRLATIDSQGLVSPAIDSQGLVSSAIDSQGLVSPAIDSQGLVSPAIDSHSLVSPAIDSQGLVSPAIDSQGLVSPAIDSQGLVSPAHIKDTEDQSVSSAFTCVTQTESVTDNSAHLYVPERLTQSIASLVSFISSGKLL